MINKICPREHPRLALRVGVTGHRGPPKLPEGNEAEIRAAVRDVLTRVIQAVAAVHSSSAAYCVSDKPLLRLSSSLAQGADTLVATVGLELGFVLQCPLPAFREIYRNDFRSAESLKCFEHLLLRADSTFELDGDRKESDDALSAQAYEAAGRLVLANSDLLIAIWDGCKGARGGTDQMVREAAHAGIFTIWINSHNPSQIAALWGSRSLADWKMALQDFVVSTLRLPEAAAREFENFLAERVTVRTKDLIGRAQERADQIAVRYATRYRMTYKAIYALAPLAVLFAVSALLFGETSANRLWEPAFSFAELFCIVTILTLTWSGRRKRSHERWLDARMVAEEFRAWQIVAPLGIAVPTFTPHPYQSTESGQRTWAEWYVRAYVREHGLPSDRVTFEYLDKYRSGLLQTINDQLLHHATKARQRWLVFKRLEHASLLLFGLTALLCLAHLLLPLILQHNPTVDGLTGLTLVAALTAVLPAFGAAAEGLEAQGEYRRLSERVEGIERRYRDIERQVGPAEMVQSLPYAELARVAHEIADIMLDELSDWRNLIRTKVLRPV